MRRKSGIKAEVKKRRIYDGQSGTLELKGEGVNKIKTGVQITTESTSSIIGGDFPNHYNSQALSDLMIS